MDADTATLLLEADTATLFMEVDSATLVMDADQEIQVASDDQPAVPEPTALPKEVDPQLEVALRRLERFLAVLGFHHAASPLFIILSCSAFLLLGVAAPILCLYFSRCGSSCYKYQIERFELWVFIIEAALAGVSLGCFSMNLFKYGMRRFLFVDEHQGHVERFQEEYVRKIQVWMLLLAFWASAHLDFLIEIWRFMPCI